jgi:hypothetical protein
MDAYISGDTGQHQVADLPHAQDEVQVGGIKTPLAGLVDDQLVGLRLQLGDDIPSRFTTYQDTAARARIADTRTDPLAPPTACWLAGRRGPVDALPGYRSL